MFGIVQQLWNLYFQAEYLLCRNSPAVFSGCRTSQPTSPKPYQILSVVGWIIANWDTRTWETNKKWVKPPRFSYSAASHPYFVIDQIYQYLSVHWAKGTRWKFRLPAFQKKGLQLGGAMPRESRSPSSQGKNMAETTNQSSLTLHVYESWQNARGHAQATHRPVRAHMRDICTAHHTLHLARSSYVNGRVETHRCSQRLIAHNMILNTFKIYGKYVYTQTYVILYIHNVHDIYTIHTLLCHKVWFHSCVYPPTPADARGSAPGNKTFDSCRTTTTTATATATATTSFLKAVWLLVSRLGGWLMARQEQQQRSSSSRSSSSKRQEQLAARGGQQQQQQQSFNCSFRRDVFGTRFRGLSVRHWHGVLVWRGGGSSSKCNGSKCINLGRVAAVAVAAAAASLE